MISTLRHLDRILRGQATDPVSLRDGTIDIPVVAICVVITVLGMIYGLCMSTFMLVDREQVEWRQLIATMVKVPLLFYLTLLVTFPSLYVFNALVGSRLSFSAVFRLIIASLAVTLALLASFGPIVAFFSFTTESYSFMVLLNVLLFAISGILGLTFLLQTLHRLAIATLGYGAELAAAVVATAEPAAGTPAVEGGDVRPAAPPAAIDRSPAHAMTSHVKAVFRIWIVVFGIVGAQMAWILRPFIGSPDLPFAWFRPRQSNFFESVWKHLLDLLGATGSM